MIHFELAPNSAKLDDHVFVITKKQKVDKYGRMKPSRGHKCEDYEVVEAVIKEIHFGWDYVSMQNAWSCALATVDTDPRSWRYIEDVRMSDIFSSRKEAEEELDRRFADGE